MNRRNPLFLPLFAIAALAACEEDPVAPDVLESSVETVAAHVVSPGSSIQAALDAADAGDRIAIEPGIYEEALVIEKDGIRLVGAAGGGVVLRNPGGADNGIFARNVSDLEIRNLTIRDFDENGVLLVRVDGFRLADLVTENNGEYGLFPVLSSHGVIERSVAVGHSDAGIYVGLSENVDIRTSVAHGNVNGFEIENSSDIRATANEAYGNTAGILVVLLPGLPVKAASGILVAGNRVYDNNLQNFAHPDDIAAAVPRGSGILVVGTDRTRVEGNDVHGNEFIGIGVASLELVALLAGLPPEAIDVEPNPDGARIRDNTVLNNGSNPPDLGLGIPGVDLLWDGTGADNCWAGNTFTTSFPPTLPPCATD